MFDNEIVDLLHCALGNNCAIFQDYQRAQLFSHQ